MEPLDLSVRPPRSCYEELDGLLLMPRTIDKLRARLPGGNPGAYFINGKVTGLSGFLLQRLGIQEAALLEAVTNASSDADVAAWIRNNTDASQYPGIGETLRRIRPQHAEDPAYFHELYAETLAANPELKFILDIVDADDRRIFGPRAAV
jgi:hypothetical protein